MKNVKLWFERVLFYPQKFDWILVVLLFPLSLVYCLIVFIKFPRKLKDKKIPIISVGNIIVGGSGKTPLTIAIAKFLKKDIFIILRGYGRKSRGLVFVSNRGKILVDVDASGDEAMEIAISTNASVIVSENREEAIDFAKSKGAEVIILDDGFDKPFKKMNLVIDVPIKNPFCLPAGGYRYSRYFLKYADSVLREGKDFERVVKVPEGDILVSAISKPQRLLKYWRGEYRFFPDHYDFKEEDVKEFRNRVVVCTKKDYVKLKKFDLDLRIIELDVKLSEKVRNFLVKFQ